MLLRPNQDTQITAVELDDLLDDGPVQHREVQGHESPLFQSYFPGGMRYQEGGIASGFRSVKPEEYVPRLFQVKRTKKTVRAAQVELKAKSLNNGDVFVLDAGREVYTWVGQDANAFEKMKGGAMAHNIVQGRNGKASRKDPDEAFWKILGGSEKDVQPTVEDVDDEDAEDIEPAKTKLYRLSDASGKMTFKCEAEKGPLKRAQLDTNDVFVVDADIALFVWIGKRTSKSEKSQAMKYAEQYLKSMSRPSTTPITRIMEGQINHVFAGCFAD